MHTACLSGSDGVIVGIGTDICDIRRIAATLARRGDRFAERVLGPGEIDVYRARRIRWPQRGVSYLATRFSAKEAFSKAIGLGMRQPMTWRACEILNQRDGRPSVRLHGRLADWFEARQWIARVSISDEGDYAVAFVTVEEGKTS